MTFREFTGKNVEEAIRVGHEGVRRRAGRPRHRDPLAGQPGHPRRRRRGGPHPGGAEVGGRRGRDDPRGAGRATTEAPTPEVAADEARAATSRPMPTRRSSWPMPATTRSPSWPAPMTRAARAAAAAVAAVAAAAARARHPRAAGRPSAARAALGPAVARARAVRVGQAGRGAQRRGAPDARHGQGRARGDDPG